MHVKVAFVPRMAMVSIGGMVMVGAAEGGRREGGGKKEVTLIAEQVMVHVHVHATLSVTPAQLMRPGIG